MEFFQMFQHEYIRTYIFSGDWVAINALAILMLIDVITGLAKAFVNKNLWSRKSLFGFGRKILVFLIITTANIIDMIMGMDGLLVAATVTFYIFNELLSITENMGQLGMPLPKKLKDVLVTIKNDDEVKSFAKEIVVKDATDPTKERNDTNGKD